MIIESHLTVGDRINGELSTMMKLATKFLAVGAVAAFAIAMSAASSEAAKRRAAAPKSCGTMGALCASDCKNGWCTAVTCGADGKWYPALLTPMCLESMCINKQKKC